MTPTRRMLGAGGAIVLAGLVLRPAASIAQSAPDPVAATASVSHVMRKAATQVAGAAAVAMAVYSIGTGSLLGGTVLALGTTLPGAFMYPINEYAWYYFVPNTNLRANHDEFDTSQSLWRTTGKYLTFKTATTANKVAWLYGYTGSPYATLTMATATFIALPVVFYVNDTAWNWYDWYSHPAPASK